MKIIAIRHDIITWFLMLLLSMSIRALAQPPDTSWLKTYGGVGSDGGRTVIETSDQGYLIAGWTWSYGSGRSDVFLIRTTCTGDTLWTRAFGSPFSDSYASALETGDNNFIVAYTRGLTTGNADISLVKIDSNGDTLWTKSHGSMTVDGCYDVQQTNDSGFVIIGWTYSGAGGADVYMIKTDANGDTLWSRTYGGPEDDYGYSIQCTNDQGYIIGGYTNSFGSGDYDSYIIKTDMHGDTLWTRVLGGNFDDFGYSVYETPDTNYLLVGATWSFGPGTPDNSNVYLIKYNTAGDTVWTKTYGGIANERIYSITQTIDNDYIIAGYTNSYGAGGYDIYVLKIDNNGDTLWTTTYGATDYDQGFSIIQTSDHGYLIAGSTLSFGAGEYDVLLIKTEPDLYILEQKIIEKSINNIAIKPNPFIDKVAITWHTVDEIAYIKIYNSAGQMIKLFDALASQPFGQITWHGYDQHGNLLPSGVYVVLFQASKFYHTQRVTIIR